MKQENVSFLSCPAGFGTPGSSGLTFLRLSRRCWDRKVRPLTDDQLLCFDGRVKCQEVRAEGSRSADPPHQPASTITFDPGQCCCEILVYLHMQHVRATWTVDHQARDDQKRPEQEEKGRASPRPSHRPRHCYTGSRTLETTRLPAGSSCLRKAVTRPALHLLLLDLLSNRPAQQSQPGRGGHKLLYTPCGKIYPKQQRELPAIPQSKTLFPAPLSSLGVAARNQILKLGWWLLILWKSCRCQGPLPVQSHLGIYMYELSVRDR